MDEQKTIAKEFSLEGKGLQMGKMAKVFFYPSEKNEGINFVRRDLDGKPSAHLGDLSGPDADTDRRSKINFGGGQYVETVEHVLAALWGAEIDNVRIELDGPEIPALDGSAKGFLEALQNSGVKKQSAPREFVEIIEPLWVEDKESFLGVFPGSAFKISYKLEYPNSSIGEQFFSEVIDKEFFSREIAPARTFCLKEETAQLLKMGYGKGADFNNTLVMDNKGPMNNALRFKNEPVRHKVLDLIGDLYLLGKPLKARIIAVRSGHKLNLELVRKIRETFLCKQKKWT